MSKRLRLLILGIFIALGILSLYPTIKWYFFTTDEAKALAASNRQNIRKEAISLAKKDSDAILEMLQGTAKDEFKDMNFSSEGFKELHSVAKQRYKDAKKHFPKNTAASEVFSIFRDKDEIYQLLLNYYRSSFTEKKQKKKSVIKLGLDLSGGVSATVRIDEQDLAERLSSTPNDQDRNDAIERAMLVLQNRIDKFGVSEPSLRKLNNDSILVEIPGEADREEINSFLHGKGSMYFIIVDEEATQKLLELQTQNPTWNYDGENAPDYIQAGTKIIEYVNKDSFGIDKHQRWIVVYQGIENYGIDGEYLEQAQVTSDPITNRPLVNFQFNAEGAQIFAKLTSDNVKKSMAIIMEDKVRAYVVISVAISDGNAIIRGFSREQANNITILLQTAALPVNLVVMNQEVIGPSLGQRTIMQGLNAISIGFFLVVLFMILYYMRAGIVAVLTLLFNLFFLLAILASFNFTLTLTGIAAIILTVGMAVDANVLIYERIKEELLQGKTRRTAIDNGFKKAFWTILDANITTLVASMFIAQLASGRIQGFAVTLSAGIITTLFTVLFISRLLFDFGTDTIKLKRMSIGWKRIQA